MHIVPAPGPGPAGNGPTAGHHAGSSHRGQRGFAALGVSLLLLLAASIALFHLHRGTVLEQRASANQWRSTSAFELAEAGLEWATGLLNSPLHIGADCRPLPASGESFRRRYLQAGTTAEAGFSIVTDAFPGCRFEGGTLACSCPGSSTAGPHSSAAHDPLLPGFTVAFSAALDPATGRSDPTAVRVTATGCNPRAATGPGPCRATTGATSAVLTGAAPGITSGIATADEGTATVSVILKLAPSLRVLPAAALTCGGDCAVGDSAELVNTDARAAGLLVHAAGGIAASGSARLQTLPGQPAAAALAANDAALSALTAGDALCGGSALFGAFFGMSLAQYAQPGGEVLSLPGCTEPTSCGERLAAAHEAGWRSFHFPDGLVLDGRAPLQTLGAAGDGVRLVSAGALRISAPLTVNGLIVSNSPRAEDLDTGSATVNGAVIACGAHRHGTGRLAYDAAALRGGALPRGPMVRVPGSWRDS